MLLAVSMCTLVLILEASATEKPMLAEKSGQWFKDNFGFNNLALKKPTNASSVYPHEETTPSRAVDGNLDTKWDGFSCFASNLSDTSPWWQVDLEACHFITSVIVTLRTDCCPERFHDVDIQIFENDPTLNPATKPQLCNSYGSYTPNQVTATIACNRGVIGRFVRLSAKERNIPNDLLQFCEVQIYGV